MFWLARYIERAEYTARILDVNFHTVLEQSKDRYRLHWDPLIVMAGEEERFRALYGEADARAVFEFLAFRQDNPSSIVQCITKARENARTIRDYISREMWEDINSLYFTVNRFNPDEEMAAGPHRFCDAIRFGSHRFHGVTDATLPHDEGWEFLRIGWFIERAEMTARLVDVQYHILYDAPAEIGGGDNHQWMAVLKSVGAYEAYHRKYHSSIEPEKVAEMLIMHPLHPALDPLQHDRSAGRLARHQRHRGGFLRERSRTPDRKSSRTIALRPHHGNFSTGPAFLFERHAADVRSDRRGHCPKLLLLRGGRMNRYHLVARHGISLRRTGFGKLQRSASAADP